MPEPPQIPTEFDNLRIPFVVRCTLPRQDLIDLREHKYGTPAFELRSHQRLSDEDNFWDTFSLEGIWSGLCEGSSLSLEVHEQLAIHYERRVRDIPAAERVKKRDCQIAKCEEIRPDFNIPG
jgi:hypothetical protein